jgi:DNA-binding CsgD family transcriptional regulator
LQGNAPARAGAFRFRLATPRDLPHCVGLLPPGCRLPPSIRRRLPEIWAGLLASDARTFPIIDNIEGEHPSNIEGFGLSVFLTDAFAEELIGTPTAYSSALFYERLVAGDKILLTREQLEAAHLGDGINVLGLHFGLRNHDLHDPRSVQVLNAGSASFYFFHSGYRIRTIIAEHFGAQAARYMERGGFRLVHDFRRISPAAFAGVPDEDVPYFFALRREWVEPAAISPLSQLFEAQPPRIYFSASERRILERALLNESDAAIAEALGISRNAVLKTWRGIYDRVDRRLPQLIPKGGAAGGRGQEKRRHLLLYLRAHLEELRPSRPRNDETGAAAARGARLRGISRRSPGRPGSRNR